MKKINKQFLLLGFSVIAVSLCAFAPDAQAQNDGTVSAVGTPSGPEAKKEFPPQPVSVAPEEEAPESAAPAPVADTSIPPAATAPSQPAQSGLTPIPGEASDTVTGTNVMGDTGKTRHSGTYYDADALVPDRDLAKTGATGPRKVDPAIEPGQKYVVVQKGASASSFEAQFVAATRALKLGRYAAAMEMYEKLYKKNHRDPRILMGLAVAQQGAGFQQSAASTYEDLLKIQPNNADAIVNLMGLMKAQYPSVTLKKLMELRNKYPTNPGVPAQIALVNAAQGDYDGAVKFFEIAASMDPRNASHIYNMAIAVDKKGNSAKAIKLYERALELDSTYGDAASGLPREQIYDRLVVLRRKV
ncbi:MAG TPA: tetratricopeptide repeat protein [Micavibrio sp.]|nr:tetratricopeptide repeat protein [Micavibrio sp.]